MMQCNPFPLARVPHSSSYVPSCSPMMIICVADPPKMVEFGILMALASRMDDSTVLLCCFRTPAGQFPCFGAVNFPLRPTSPKLRCRARTLRFAAAKIRVQKSLLDIPKPFRKQSIASRAFFFFSSFALFCLRRDSMTSPLPVSSHPQGRRRLYRQHKIHTPRIANI